MARKTTHVSFRLLDSAHRELAHIAEARGVDISALLNWIITGALPELLRQEAERQQGWQQSLMQTLALEPLPPASAGTEAAA